MPRPLALARHWHVPLWWPLPTLTRLAAHWQAAEGACMGRRHEWPQGGHGVCSCLFGAGGGGRFSPPESKLRAPPSPQIEVRLAHWQLANLNVQLPGPLARPVAVVSDPGTSPRVWTERLRKPIRIAPVKVRRWGGLTSYSDGQLHFGQRVFTCRGFGSLELTEGLEMAASKVWPLFSSRLAPSRFTLRPSGSNCDHHRC